MRRCAFKVVVFLLLGALVNIAVAWGVVFARDQDLASVEGHEEVGGRERDRWWINRITVVGTRITKSHWSGPVAGAIGWGFRHEKPGERFVPRWAPHLSPDYHERIANSDAFAIAREDGWPIRSLHGMSGYMIWPRIDEELGEWVPEERRFSWAAITLTYPAQGDGGSPRFLPYSPLWPGFAINTIFYAAILWLLCAIPFVVRRYFRGRRIKRGLCPACAYPVGGSPVCTECGKPVMWEKERPRAASIQNEV